MAIPYFRTLSYASGQVTGSWDAALGASGYTFEVLRPDSTVLAQADLGLAMTGSLDVDPWPLPAGTCHGQVRGTRGQTVSGWAVLPIEKPAGPAVTLSYAEPYLVATWPDAPADSYLVQFFNPSGQQIGPFLAVNGHTLSVPVPLPDPVAGAYGAQVTGNLDGQFPGVPGPRATLTVLSLAAPVLGPVTQSDGMLSFTWSAVAGAQGYTAQVISGSGTILGSADVTDPTASVTPSPAVAAGASCQVQVRARGANGLSPWATVTFTV